MSYIPLTDPFLINFENDGIEYRAKVSYLKSELSCTNLFNVAILNPEGIESFYLKEKPTLNSGGDNMVWVDENDKLTMLYQVIGTEIEKYLRKNLGIFLIDAPVPFRDEANIKNDG